MAVPLLCIQLGVTVEEYSGHGLAVQRQQVQERHNAQIRAVALAALRTQAENVDAAKDALAQAGVRLAEAQLEVKAAAQAQQKKKDELAAHEQALDEADKYLKSLLNKSVASEPEPEPAPAPINLSPDLRLLQKPSRMKLRKHDGSYKHRRWFSVDTDTRQVTWAKKIAAGVCKKQTMTGVETPMTSPQQHELGFTILTTTGPIHVVAEDEQARERWVQGIKHVMRPPMPEPEPEPEP